MRYPQTRQILWIHITKATKAREIPKQSHDKRKSTPLKSSLVSNGRYREMLGRLREPNPTVVNHTKSCALLFAQSAKDKKSVIDDSSIPSAESNAVHIRVEVCGLVFLYPPQTTDRLNN